MTSSSSIYCRKILTELFRMFMFYKRAVIPDVSGCATKEDVDRLLCGDLKAVLTILSCKETEFGDIYRQWQQTLNDRLLLTEMDIADDKDKPVDNAHDKRRSSSVQFVSSAFQQFSDIPKM